MINYNMCRNILIVTDNKLLSEKLHQIIKKIHKFVVVFFVNNIEEGYNALMQRQIHLFIVDIKLGDVSGFRFIQELRSVKRYEFMPVILLSSIEDSKLYSYSQLGCFGYFEKPFDSKQLAKSINKALNFPVLTDRDRYIYFRKDGVLFSKCVNDIYFIEISRAGVMVYGEKDILEVPYKSCSEILDELGSLSFIQCNRQVIVNSQYIEQIDYARRYIKLKNFSKLIDIGPVMKSRFKAAMEAGTDN